MKIQTGTATNRTQGTRRKTISKTVKTASASRSKSAPAATIQSGLILGIPDSEMTPRVQTAIMTLLSEVSDMRKEIELAQRRISELENLADMDSLLPISNRRSFVREMSRMISYSERYGINSSLLYIDMNDLKVINDTYGHAAGDAALIKLAAIISNNLRDSDIFGRLGGDEFGIILPKANENDAQNKAKKLIEKIQNSDFSWEGTKIKLNVAYGIYPIQSGESADQALDGADKKMYTHKQSMKQNSSR